jgi:uncharacterized protein (TIGR02147 family)
MEKIHNIFSYLEYKEVIRAQVSANREERGYIAKLADAAGCQRSFLSQALHSTVHLTPDHAMGLALFWNLSELEREYFMELVLFNRSGSKQFRKISEEKLKRLREQSENIGLRLKKVSPLEEAAQLRFYSAWHASAIHILLTIPEFQTISALARRLAVSEFLVSDCLSMLQQMGLAEQREGRWSAAHSDMHLSKDSPIAWLHHSNWRTKAVADSREGPRDSVHYTALYSLSRADFERLKALCLHWIEESRQLVQPSVEEDLACFVLDWFWI